MSRFTLLNAQLQPVQDGEEAVAELDTQQNLIIALPNIEFEELQTFDKAKQMCADLRLGGHDDWRLPTVAEAFACVDHTRYNPATQSQAFASTTGDWCWTSTPCAWRSGASWCVVFVSGYVSANDLDNRCLVRAVRSVSPAPDGTTVHTKRVVNQLASDGLVTVSYFERDVAITELGRDVAQVTAPQANAA